MKMSEDILQNLQETPDSVAIMPSIDENGG